MQLSRELAAKVLQTVDAGLVSGVGNPVPGQMCVEAAVCYALGQPHGDEPKCVGSAVRRFKIRLNDSCWPSDQARTTGMRKLAIAQLGSDTIDQSAFAKIVVRETIRRILPITLRECGKHNPKFADRLEAMAALCESHPDRDTAYKAKALAFEVRKDAYAAAYAYAAAAADADAAEDTAAYAYAYAAADVRLKILQTCADIGLQALIELKSPGCEWLDLCEAETA